MTASMPLRATLRRVGPGAVIMDLAGDINRDAEPTLNKSFSAATATGCPEVLVLNFAEAAYINSSGIALIIGLLARARQQACPVAACGLSDHYREIFEITRLSDFISIHTDERAALAHASESE
jgi:anti-anti-sigma factor